MLPSAHRSGREQHNGAEDMNEAAVDSWAPQGLTSLALQRVGGRAQYCYQLYECTRVQYSNVHVYACAWYFSCTCIQQQYELWSS